MVAEHDFMPLMWTAVDKVTVCVCVCPQVLQSYGGPDLVRSVISPHLSKDTVDFLRGHLTPKEMTTFEMLGDGWTKPRCRNTALI